MKTIFTFAAAGLAGLAACLGQVQEQRPQAQPAAQAAAGANIAVRALTNAPAPARADDAIELSNGDFLRGRFRGWEPGQGARWQHDAIAGPVVVVEDKIRRLRLQRPPERPPQEPQARIHLINGDRLSVNMVSLDDKEALFESWYAGQLKVSRSAISNLTFLYQHGDLIYHGPAGLEGWMQSEPNRMIGGAIVQVVDGQVVVEERPRGENEKPAPGPWIFTGDAFEAGRPGGLGRDLKLPRVSMVSFDMECVNYPALTLHLYSDAADRFSGLNALSFTFSGRMAYFRRWLATGGMRQIANVDHGRFSPGVATKARVTVCADLDQQTMALYMDDVLLRKFSLAGHADGLGTAMVFQQQGASTLKISNLSISRWNGVFEESSPVPGGGSEDLLFLNNRDKISGRLLGIRGGKADFQTEFSKVEVPVDRIQHVVFARTKDAPRPPGRWALVQLSDLSRLTLAIEKWNDQTLAGNNPWLGALQVKAGAVAVVQFE